MAEPIDLHKLPSAIVKKAPVISDSSKTQIDTLAQLKWLKIDIPESITEQEKNVKWIILEDLKKRWEFVPDNLTVKFISKWVFATKWDEKDVSVFVNERWETILNIFLNRQRLYIENWEVFKFLWLTEKIEGWEHKIYREGSNNPIRQDSLDFFKTWQQIVFTADVFMSIYN